jgi:hypothetical protein
MSIKVKHEITDAAPALKEAIQVQCEDRKVHVYGRKVKVG